MSFYHLGLWWLRKKNKVALTFAIFSAVMALRTVVFNNYLLSYVFPQLSWQIMYILAYSTLYAGVPIFLVYFRQTFEEKRFKIIFISNYIISLFFLLTLCLKSIIYTKLLMYYQAIALIYIVLLTILLISYSIKKKKGARILLLSITIFATTVINDILFYNDLIKTISLVPLGTFIMLLGQALTLGRIFTNSFEQNEILADKLEIQNKNLESIVEQRTKQLKEQNEELTVTEEELRQTLDEFKTLNRQFELKNIELKKYFTAIEQSNIAFLITDLHNKIEYVNSFFTTITGYTKEEVIGKNPRILNSGQNPKELYTGLWSKILNGEVWQGEFVNKAKDGHVFIEKAIITPLFNEGVITNYITIKEDITELRKQEIEISEKNNKLEHLNTEVNSILKDLMSSLSYAKKIQKSVFPSTEELTNILHDYFLFYKPREIVGGDFYFVRQIDNMKIIAVGDCTGHGVPGCFLTILATSLLIEYTNKIDKLSPAEILENIRKRVITFFSTDKNKIQDGFDLGLIVENTETKILTFAGANISAITYQNNELIEYKAVKSPIGYYPIQRNFENQTIPIKDNLMLYLASDGFIDQFDEHNNKFSKKQFKDLLSKIALLPLEVQNQEIVNSFIKWKGNFRQIDDITVLGIKF
jgi:PAS domain S-box-containing protein